MENTVPARLSAHEGKKFALTVGAAFLVLAGVAWRRDHLRVAGGLAALGGLLAIAGVLIPGQLGPAYRAWMGFAHLLSRITTPIFLAATYYLAFFPTGMLMRLFARNPMVRKPVDGSYWVDRPDGAGRRSDLERQF
ncbi:MAG: hypothetical protein WEG36_09055 [Gemmatimonadota bacterium]